MQRRAAALYAAFFIVIAAGAYGMFGVAQEPGISLQNPDHTLSQGQEITVNGLTYTANAVEGGQAELAWTNMSARFTETLDASRVEFSDDAPTDEQARLIAANGDVPTATIDGSDFRVVVKATGGEPTTFALVEAFVIPDNVTTQTVDNRTYVVVQEPGGPSLVSLAAWIQNNLGEPATRSYTTGDSLQYQNATTTVEAVSNESVTLRWTGARENTVSIEEGDTVTLNGREFVAHFPDPGTLELSRNIRAYERQVEVQESYDERINGLWGVSLLSGFAAILLLGAAYLPSRY